MLGLRVGTSVRDQLRSTGLIDGAAAIALLEAIRELDPRLAAEIDRFEAERTRIGALPARKRVVFFGRFVALLRTYAALLAGANGLRPLVFFIWNATGGITWACVFGFGGYLLGRGLERIAGPIGWVALALAVVGGFALWRFYKTHEERLLAAAEREMAREGA